MKRRVWNPIRIIRALQDEVDNTFSELIDGPWGRLDPAEWSPAIDVYESSDEYIISVDLPGVNEDNIDVTVEDHNVTIYGTRHSASITETAKAVRSERTIGRFYRTLHLPAALDPDNIRKSCEGGVCFVHIRKRD
jgi:HSP20 family protein